VDIADTLDQAVIPSGADDLIWASELPDAKKGEHDFSPHQIRLCFLGSFVPNRSPNLLGDLRRDFINAMCRAGMFGGLL
jgi:hypothetical protein